MKDFRKHCKHLAPNEVPPLPACIPLGARSPKNLWNFYSVKLNREVFFDGDLEHDHGVLVEADPEVLWYCEHYPWVRVEIQGRTIGTIFDMTICYRNGYLELREVKCLAQLQKPDERTNLQLQAQEIWCLKEQLPYSVKDETYIHRHPILIKNWKRILAYLSLPVDPRLIGLVLKVFLKKSACTLEFLIETLDSENPQEIVRAIFSQLHCGVLMAELKKKEISSQTLFWIAESQIKKII